MFFRIARKQLRLGSCTYQLLVAWVTAPGCSQSSKRCRPYLRSLGRGKVFNQTWIIFHPLVAGNSYLNFHPKQTKCHFQQGRCERWRRFCQHLVPAAVSLWAIQSLRCELEGRCGSPGRVRIFWDCFLLDETCWNYTSTCHTKISTLCSVSGTLMPCAVRHTKTCRPAMVTAFSSPLITWRVACNEVLFNKGTTQLTAPSSSSSSNNSKEKIWLDYTSRDHR